MPWASLFTNCNVNLPFYLMIIHRYHSYYLHSLMHTNLIFRAHNSFLPGFYQHLTKKFSQPQNDKFGDYKCEVFFTSFYSKLKSRIDIFAIKIRVDSLIFQIYLRWLLFNAGIKQGKKKCFLWFFLFRKFKEKNLLKLYILLRFFFSKRYLLSCLNH